MILAVIGAQDYILLYRSLSKYEKLIMAWQENQGVWIGFHSSWTWHRVDNGIALSGVMQQ